jgi:hypothetical protein
MARYRTCPIDGVVVSFDELGPISLQPSPGHCYAQRKRPWRQRAAYVRRGGVAYFFGACDVHADVLFGVYRLAEMTHGVLAFYPQIRLATRSFARILAPVPIVHGFEKHRRLEAAQSISSAEEILCAWCSSDCPSPLDPNGPGVCMSL